MFSLRSFLRREKQNFPPSLLLVIAAMALEYAAWGFIDPFLSTLLVTVFDNYFLAGAVIGVAHLSILLSLFALSELLYIFPPIRIAAFGKMIIIIAVMGYFLAAFYQIPWLFFVSAFVNGLGAACREVTSGEILIEKCTRGNASTILGWNAGFRDGAWATMMMLSGVILVFLAGFFEVSLSAVLPTVFLWGIPFLVVSFFLLLRAHRFFGDVPLSSFPRHHFSFRHCFDFLGSLSRMNSSMKFAMVMLFFLQLIQSTTALLLPLLALSLHLSIDEIGLLMGVVCIPLLLSSFFSLFEDRGDRLLFILGGLLFSMIPLFLLAQTDTPFWVGILSVLVSVSIAVIRPASLGLIAAYIDHHDAPAAASLQVFFNRIGAVLGSVGMGFVAQNFGIQNAFLLMGIGALFFALVAIFVRYHFIPRVPQVHFFKIHPFHARFFPFHW